MLRRLDQSSMPCRTSLLCRDLAFAGRSACGFNNLQITAQLGPVSLIFSVCDHCFRQTGHQPFMFADPVLVVRLRENIPCRAGEFGRKLGSALPFRVNPLILHPQADSGAY